MIRALLFAASFLAPTGYDARLFSATEMAEMKWSPCDAHGPTRTCRDLTYEETVEAICAIDTYVQKKETVEARVVACEWPRYFLQVWAESSGGSRVVNVQGFCISLAGYHEHWDQAIVWVDDGGPCYFHAEYDLEMKTILWFSPNGPYGFGECPPEQSRSFEDLGEGALDDVLY